MSVMAAGQVNMKMKKPVPEKIVELTKKEIHLTYHNLDYVAEFDGNWRLDDVIDAVELLNPYVKSGSISYWSDEGEANAEFCEDRWYEEWQEHYYPSELPNWEISSNSRVGEILNIIANDLMACSDSEPAVELLLNKCKLTDNEIKLYNLSWLADLRREYSEEDNK